MRKEEFFEVLGELDDDIVEGAKAPKKEDVSGKDKKNVWIKWGAIAACLCLVVGGVFLFNQNIGNNSRGNNIAMLFTEAKVIEVYSPRSVLVEIVEENIYNENTKEKLFLAGDIVQADFNEDIALHFAAGDIVIIGRGDTAKVDYSQEPCIAQCNSIRPKAKEDFRNIRVAAKDNERGEGAEDAGLAFAEAVYGAFLANLPEDNNYRITDYKMLDYLLLETTGNSVSGEFSFAIKAVDVAYYADNSVSGTGEYEGWLILRKCFTLEHRNTPYWKCIMLEDVAPSNDIYTEYNIP